MRIVITNPFCWPYVRRGSERYIAELARYLTGRGYDVTTISTKPGKGQTEILDGSKRVLCRQLWTPALAKLRLEPIHTFFPSSLMALLLDSKADFVHSIHYVDAFAALLARKVKKFRNIYYVAGVPVPESVPRMPPDRWMLRQVIQHVEQPVVASQFSGRVMKHYYGRDARVLQGPVDIDAFPVGTGPSDGRPTILSVAAFDDRRKNLKAVVEAFRLVKQRVPEARLRLSGNVPDHVRKELIEPLPDQVRAGVEVLGMGHLADLPKMYREATVTVHPAMWETHGLVLLESLASGTPVVAVNHAGPSEIVTDPTIGLVFDPQTEGFLTENYSGFADAILAAFELEAKPGTRARCREHANRFSWSALGPKIEQLYIKNCGI